MSRKEWEEGKLPAVSAVMARTIFYNHAYLCHLNLGKSINIFGLHLDFLKIDCFTMVSRERMRCFHIAQAATVCSHPPKKNSRPAAFPFISSAAFIERMC